MVVRRVRQVLDGAYTTDREALIAQAMGDAPAAVAKGTEDAPAAVAEGTEDAPAAVAEGTGDAPADRGGEGGLAGDGGGGGEGDRGDGPGTPGSEARPARGTGRGVTLKAFLRPLVVETDEDLVLVDTGMPAIPDRVAAHHERLGEPGLVTELARLGFSSEDVTVVVLTHLHYDHMGNIDLFADADLFVQRDHLDFARDAPAPWSIGFADRTWEHAEFTLLDGDATVCPGVRVHPTPGHVPGHQSVIVDRPGTRPALFPGDAAPMPRNLERGTLPGIVQDADAAKRSLEWLMAQDADFYHYHCPPGMDTAGPWDRDDET